MTLATPAVRENRQIRCLVIQLSRLGDTLQSLMALRAAKELYPGLEVHLVVREGFGEAAKRVPWLSEVILLPTQRILGPILNGEMNKPEGMAELAKWMAPLTDKPWDLVLNWSFSEASSFLTALVPGRIKLGYSRRRDSSFSCLDGWSQYFQAVIQGGVQQNIHITDILTTQLLTALQIHYGDPVHAHGAVVTSRKFFSLNLQDSEKAWRSNQVSRKWIAVHLGADRKAYSWEVGRWAEVVAKMVSRHPEFSVVLLGKKEDKLREEAFFNHLNTTNSNKNIVSLVGLTGFDFWASILSECQWVFSESSAAVQLASVLGTRTVHLSLGPNRWSEMGPYGNGHYVVTSNETCLRCADPSNPLQHTCRQNISPEAVYAVWSYGSSEWAHRRQVSWENHLRQLGYTERASKTKVYRSKIRNIQDGGGVFYEPIAQSMLSIQEWSSMVEGHIARAWYCGWVPGLGRELNRGAIGSNLLMEIRTLEEPMKELKRSCEDAVQILNNLSQFGKSLKSEKIMSIQEREQLRLLGSQLNLVDSKIEEIGNRNEMLKSFSMMCKVLMHNLPGTQIADLGREGIECYRQLNEGATLFVDWIKHTLNLAKPVAVQTDGLAGVEKLRRPSEKDLVP